MRLLPISGEVDSKVGLIRNTFHLVKNRICKRKVTTIADLYPNLSPEQQAGEKLQGYFEPKTKKTAKWHPTGTYLERGFSAR
jgi:hypothetical protein